MAKTYKHKPFYLLAKENGERKGVLPLFLMRSMIFGKKLVSVLFAPYGGVCADNRRIEKAPVEEAKRINRGNFLNTKIKGKKVAECL